MSPTLRKYGLLAIKALISLAFLGAGIAKLAGVPDMVAVYEMVGLGQWFRYVTGAIEIGAVVLLWVPGRQWIGAGLLVCTMIGAVLTHVFILGPSMVPALVLGLLSALVLYAHRPNTA